MVGPLTDAERARSVGRIKIAIVLLFGFSTGMITTQGDASIGIVVAAVVTGLVVGAVLVWYLFPETEDLSSGSIRRKRFDR